MSPISSFLVVLSLGMAMRAFGQPAHVPRRYVWARGKYWGGYEGFVVTKDGTTARGRINFSGTRSCYMGSLGEPGTFRFPYKNIQRMRIYAMDDSTEFTDLVNIHRGSRFWQIRAGTDSVGVVDNGFGGRNGSRMYLVNGRRRKKIYGSWTFYNHYMKIGPLLLAFIQRYYPTPQPGETEMEMMNYLAAKAAELER
jgi:hypothetical protein